MEKATEKKNEKLSEDGEALSDVLTLEVLGPIKRTLELWDNENCGGAEVAEAALYGLRDAYILAADNLKAICNTLERDIGNLQIDAPWGPSFLDRRTYEKAFLQENA
ncbi:MAG: hypothetical protein ACYC5X_04780 [Syntrophales bacterium]